MVKDLMKIYFSFITFNLKIRGYKLSKRPK